MLTASPPRLVHTVGQPVSSKWYSVLNEFTAFYRRFAGWCFWGVFALQVFSVGVCVYHMLRPGGADFDTGPSSLGKGDVEINVCCCRTVSFFSVFICARAAQAHLCFLGLLVG